jgi:hypothetical protein
MDNLIYDLTYFRHLRKQHWIIKLIKNILFVVVIIIAIISIIICISLFFGWKIPIQTKTIQDGFSDEQSLYDLMEKEAQISNVVYLQKIRDADVIQSNPWIMIEPVNKNATIHPRDVLDRLTGQQPDLLVSRPRSYYEYSDVLYTGLPL